MTLWNMVRCTFVCLTVWVVVVIIALTSVTGMRGRVGLVAPRQELHYVTPTDKIPQAHIPNSMACQAMCVIGTQKVISLRVRGP